MGDNSKAFLSMDPIFLPDPILEIFKRFSQNGKEAYLVGGFVRDSVLKRNTFDFDITTSATPKEVINIFADMRVIETGIKHGTVTVLTKAGAVEITTFRTDGDYTDNRHPDKVEFSKTLEEDLARRDFTINAVCYHPEKGYVDPFFGIKDIERKIIKAVGEPEKRFKEDSLRILRALRFAATLGFSIEGKTSAAVLGLAELIKNVSVERIFAEFVKTLLGDNAAEVFKGYFSVFAKGIEPLKERLCEDFSFSSLNLLEKDVSLRLAAFIIAIGGDSLFAERLLSYLKSDNKTKEDTKKLLRGFLKEVPKNGAEIKLFLNAFGPEITFKIFSLFYAFGKADQDSTKHLNQTVLSILETKECYSLKDLKINGKDLVGLGIQEKEVGIALERALLSVISGETENEKNALLKFVKHTKGSA